MWLNGRIGDQPRIERELFATEDQAEQALANAIAKHNALGRRCDDKMSGPRAYFEVTDRKTGEFVAKHWLSDEPDSPEP